MSRIASRFVSANAARLVAAALAVLPLLAGAARATQVTINLQGKVLVLAHTGNINAEQQLAAKGVTAGVPASLKLVLEDSTPGVLMTSPYNFMQYDMAVVDVVISAGTWQAHFAPPSGMEATNFVQVADNINYLGTYDLWNGTALGVDTDNILSQDSTPAYGTFFMHFSNSPPTAATGDALVEDLKLYKTESQVRFFGNGGTLTVDFTKAPGGPDAALARQGELKAAAKLGSSLLKGLGKLTAAGPDADPLGTAKDALLQGVADTFGLQYVAAITKAEKKGGTAPLGESDKQYASDYLMGGLQTQADAINAQIDNTDAVDRAVRGTLLKALAAESRADFIAYSKFVANSDLVKLTNALDRARTKLEKKMAATLKKAGKKGYVYFGPDSASISAALKPFVEAFSDLTSTGV